MTIAWIALGGGAGAALRYLVGRWADAHWRPPLLRSGTLAVNVLGSLLLGALVGWQATRSAQGAWIDIVGTGLLGGFTTFSAASVESARLLTDPTGPVAVSRLAQSLASALGMAVSCVLAAALGWWAAAEFL